MNENIHPLSQTELNKPTWNMNKIRFNISLLSNNNIEQQSLNTVRKKPPIWFAVSGLQISLLLTIAKIYIFPWSFNTLRSHGVWLLNRSQKTSREDTQRNFWMPLPWISREKQSKIKGFCYHLHPVPLFFYVIAW